jgi:GTPase
MMRPELPEGVETVFISAVAETGLMPLKDLLWTTINA